MNNYRRECKIKKSKYIHVSLKSNAVSNWLYICLNIFLMILLTPLLVRHLGKYGYGIWTVTITIVGYHGLFDVGIRSAITRFVALSLGRENYEELNKVFSTTFIFFLLLGIVIILLACVLGTPIAVILKIQNENNIVFKKLLILLGISAAINFPGIVYRSVLIGHEKIVHTNIVKAFVLVIRFSLVLGLILMGYGLSQIAYSYLIASGIELIFSIVLVKKLVPYVKFEIAYVQYKTFIKLIGYGTKSFVSIIADQLRFNIDSIVIVKWVGIPQVAVYRIGSQIVQYLVKLVVGVSSVFTPRFARLEGQNKYEELRRIFLDTLSISSIIGVGLCLTAAIFGGIFITIWVGSEYKDTLGVLWILCISYTLGMSQVAGVSLMYALNKHKLYAFINILEGIINVIISIILSKSYGIYGVAMGTAIPMILVKTFIQPVLIIKISKIEPKDYIYRIVIPIGCSVLCVFASYYLGLLTEWENYGYLYSILTGIGIIILYIFVVFYIFQILGLLQVKKILKSKKIKNFNKTNRV